MNSKLVNLTLPAFAFVEGSGHEKNVLEGRNVILHTRSASIVEILEKNDTFFLEGVLTYNFSYLNSLGIKEKLVAALHYSATLDRVADRELLINEVLKPAAKWFCDYCTWEDNNIMRDL